MSVIPADMLAHADWLLNSDAGFSLYFTYLQKVF